MMSTNMLAYTHHVLQRGRCQAIMARHAACKAQDIAQRQWPADHDSCKSPTAGPADASLQVNGSLRPAALQGLFP